MEKVRIGFVGAGGTLSYCFGPLFPYLNNGIFVAAMDPDERRRKEVSKEFGIPTYTTIDKMFDKEKIDAVIIGSPVFAHEENAVKSAEAGKHILCEKPMARTIAECDRMIKAANKNNIILMPGFMKRFNAQLIEAKRMIDDGELGEICQVRVDWCQYNYNHNGWRHAFATLGGVYQDHGSHIIDLCRWWLGDITEVSAEVNIFIADKEREVEDQVVSLFRHKNRSISFHNLNRLTHMHEDERYEIFGTKGTLEINYGGTGRYSSFIASDPFTMVLHKKGQETIDITPWPEWTSVQKKHQYLVEMEHFCDCIIKNKKPEVTAEDGRKAIEVINAVYLSSWKKEKIHLPLTKCPDLDKIFKGFNQEKKGPGWKPMSRYGY